MQRWFSHSGIRQLSSFVSVMLFRFKCIIFRLQKAGCKSLFVERRGEDDPGNNKISTRQSYPWTGSQHFTRIPTMAQGVGRDCWWKSGHLRGRDDIFSLSLILLWCASWLWLIRGYKNYIWWWGATAVVITVLYWIVNTDNTNILPILLTILWSFIQQTQTLRPPPSPSSGWLAL